MNIRDSIENRQILQEASEWFVDFRLTEMDKGRRRAFMRWLKRSPEHIRAYMEISGTYAKLPTPSIAQQSDVDRFIEKTRARVNVVALDRERDVASVAPLLNQKSQRQSRRPVLLAASIAIVCIFSAMAIALFATRAPVYVTETAEHRSITLADGSKIALNARTKIRIAFTSTERRVDLLAGQAQFHVARDVKRPFTVSGPRARVRAVGTRFDVNLKKSGTVVTVLEGRVAVTGRDALPQMIGSADVNTADEILLNAGEQVVITPEKIARPARANVSAMMAWTHDELEFDETPLADVVEEFNRHSRRPIVIEPRALEQFRISGVYSSDDSGSLLRFLHNQADFVVTETDTEIRIRRK